MNRRIEKVNQLLKEEISKFLEECHRKEHGLITVTSVETSSDLKHATAWISIFDESKKEEILEELKEIIPGLQLELNQKLTMRRVPKVSFEIDRSEKHVQRIEELLRKEKAD